MSVRHPIRFDGWYAILSSLCLLFPASSYVELEEDHVQVRMGWAFRSAFPRRAVAAAREHTGFTLSRGVHGFAGRWLVNGSARGILEIDLQPDQAARVMGVPVRLRQLMVSVEDPERLAKELRG